MKNIFLWFLISALFCTKLIDSLLFKVHLVNLVLVAFIVFIVLTSSALRFDKIWLAYISLLGLNVLIGYATGDVGTGYAVAPVISGYSYPLQPVIGFIYASRYLLTLGFIIATGFTVSQRQFQKLVNFIFGGLAVACILAILEFLIPSFHNYLSSKGDYDPEFSFVYRGVSIFLNVYDGSFAMMVFVALAFYKYLKSRRKTSLIWVLVGSAAVMIHGTRTGYMGVPIFFLIYLLASELSFMQKARILGSATMVCIALVIALGFLVPDVSKNIESLLTLSDSVGSTEQHLGRGAASLPLILRYPFGVGTGKTNFAAIDNPIWFGTESFLLSLALDAGILSVVLFLTFHWKLLKRLWIVSYDKDYARVLSAYVMAVLILAFVNFQCFSSVTIGTFIAVLIGVHFNISAAVPNNPRHSIGEAV